MEWNFGNARPDYSSPGLIKIPAAPAPLSALVGNRRRADLLVVPWATGMASAVNRHPFTTAPVNVKTGAPVNWYKLPVINHRFPKFATALGCAAGRGKKRKCGSTPPFYCLPARPAASGQARGTDAGGSVTKVPCARTREICVHREREREREQETASLSFMCAMDNGDTSLSF